MPTTTRLVEQQVVLEAVGHEPRAAQVGEVGLREAAPVGTGDEQPVELHLGAVPAGDLADLGDGPAALAVPPEVDEEVDGVGDQQGGDRELDGLGALGDVLGQLLPRRQRRVVVDRRQARMAVLHRQQHLAGRVAVADLADDQPLRVELATGSL